MALASLHRFLSLSAEASLRFGSLPSLVLQDDGISALMKEAGVCVEEEEEEEVGRSSSAFFLILRVIDEVNLFVSCLLACSFNADAHPLFAFFLRFPREFMNSSFYPSPFLSLSLSLSLSFFK